MAADKPVAAGNPVAAETPVVVAAVAAERDCVAAGQDFVAAGQAAVVEQAAKRQIFFQTPLLIHHPTYHGNQFVEYTL